MPEFTPRHPARNEPTDTQLPRWVSSSQFCCHILVSSREVFTDTPSTAQVKSNFKHQSCNLSLNTAVRTAPVLSAGSCLHSRVSHGVRTLLSAASGVSLVGQSCRVERLLGLQGCHCMSSRLCIVALAVAFVVAWLSTSVASSRNCLHRP